MRIETFFHMLCSKEDNHETTLSDLCRSLSFAGPDEISEVDNLREGIEALCDLVAGSRPVRFFFQSLFLSTFHTKPSITGTRTSCNSMFESSLDCIS